MFAVFRDESAMTQIRQRWEVTDELGRRQILEALQRLDQVLSSDPGEKGESRSGKTRILFEAPVAVLFRIDRKRSIVRVVRAWTWRNRSENESWAA